MVGVVTPALVWEPYEPTRIAPIANLDLALGYAAHPPFHQPVTFLTAPDFAGDLPR